MVALGSTPDGAPVRIDVDRLVESRLLAQANSGGGKSWLLRRLLEQTHGKVQHLVLDPEGEFHTLREKFDYVLAARTGGDVVADVRSAALLAHRLLELGVSAVLDLYELKAHERVRFVRLFVEALVDAPKNLWHPVLVVVDEAHVFCPQVGEAESAGAVKDLLTRGRKRGFCGVIATQRLSKLHKDVAAEANCKLIGRATLDVDLQRAAHELGFTSREDVARIRSLPPGRFFAYGPGLSLQVVEVQIGDVQTTHPRPGNAAAAAVPPPRDKVRKVLAQLADLPQAAEEEVRSLVQARQRIAELERAARAKPAAPAARVERVEVPVLKDAQLARVEKLAEKAAAAVAAFGEAGRELRELAGRAALMTVGARGVARAAATNGVHRSPIATCAPQPRLERMLRAAAAAAATSGTLSGPEQRIVDALAELEALSVPFAERPLLALMAGYRHPNSKGFANAIGALRTAGRVEYPGDGVVALTDAGRAVAQAKAAPTTPAEVHERVLALLDRPGERVLRPLLESYPEPLERAALAAAAQYGHPNSKGFANTIGRLRSLGLISYPSSGMVVAAPVLFLEGAR